MARSYQDLLANAREQVPEVQVADLAARREAGDPPLVIDVREQSEWDEGHITDSLFTPYHDIHALPSGVDPSRPVAVICSSGQRAATAASLLQRYGAEQPLHVVDGGVGTWARSGGPIESGSGAAKTAP